MAPRLFRKSYASSDQGGSQGKGRKEIGAQGRTCGVDSAPVLAATAVGTLVGAAALKTLITGALRREQPESVLPSGLVFMGVVCAAAIWLSRMHLGPVQAFFSRYAGLMIIPLGIVIGANQGFQKTGSRVASIVLLLCLSTFAATGTYAERELGPARATAFATMMAAVDPDPHAEWNWEELRSRLFVSGMEEITEQLVRRDLAFMKSNRLGPFAQ